MIEEECKNNPIPKDEYLSMFTDMYSKVRTVQTPDGHFTTVTDLSKAAHIHQMKQQLSDIKRQFD